MEPLSEDEVRDIDRAKFDEVIKDTKNNWNKLNPVKKFEELDPKRQTVLASRTMQEGTGWFGKTTYDKFFASAKADDWATAKREFSELKASPGRSREEAKLLLPAE